MYIFKFRRKPRIFEIRNKERNRTEKFRKRFEQKITDIKVEVKKNMYQ